MITFLSLSLSLSRTALLPRTAGATYSPELNIFRGVPTLFHWELLLFSCPSTPQNMFTISGLHLKEKKGLRFASWSCKVKFLLPPPPGVVDYYHM